VHLLVGELNIYQMQVQQYKKACRSCLCFIKIWQEWRTLYMRAGIHFWVYLAQCFLEWEMFQTKFQRKSRHTFCVLFSKMVSFT